MSHLHWSRLSDEALRDLSENAPTARLRRKYARMLDPRRDGADGLRGYLAAALLPSIARHDRSSPYCLPPEGRRTHRNKLRVRHDADRTLAKIYKHKPKAFSNAVLAYHNQHIYDRRRARSRASKLLTSLEREALVLEAKGFRTEASYEDIPYPCNMDALCRWILERPIQTMQRAIHVAFPNTTLWHVDRADPTIVPNMDPNLWRPYIWRFHPDELNPEWRADPDEEEETDSKPTPMDSMVFAVQPPWILGPQDLKNVAACKGLPAFNKDGTPPEVPLRTEQRVWGKLHDTCKALDCHAFVLTNYHGWLFGTFSDDWMSARTTDVRMFNSKEPTVLQSLVYWVAASMKLPNARHWMMPVPDEPEAGSSSANPGTV